MYYKVKVQRRDFSFDISIEYPHKNEDLIQKQIIWTPS